MSRNASPGSSRSRIEIGGMFASFLAALLISVRFAYFAIFSRFQSYDDEGYVLISLKSFFQGHALYDQVYSSFQPFVHFFYLLVFKLWGVPLCHDSIRLLTIVLWLAGSAINAFIAYKLTKSTLLTLLVFALSVTFLQTFTNEPGHPQALAYMLVAGVVALFASIGGIPRAAFALGVGVLLGSLLLTKVNVGFYTTLAAGFTICAGTSGVMAIRLQRALGAVMVAVPVIFLCPRIESSFWTASHIFLVGILALVVFTPLLLHGSRRLWGAIAAAALAAISLTICRSANIYEFYLSVVLTFSIYSVALVAQVNRPDAELDYRDWLPGLYGGTGVVFALLAATILRGTSLHGLMDGLFWGPARMPAAFVSPSAFSNAGMPIDALVGLAGCCWYLWARVCAADQRCLDYPLAVGKAVFGLMMVFRHGLGWPPGSLPFVWLAAVRETGHSDEQFARIGVVAVAIMQPLLAYPVSGSQTAPAAALIIIVGAVCLADAARILKTLIPNRFQVPRLWPVIGFMVALAILVPFNREASWTHRLYNSLTPLELPGASRIRLQEKHARVYRDLVGWLARPEVETFLTLPGMNSLYFWAQKDPPTGFNVSDWMYLFDDHCQQQIWETVSKHSNVLVVKNEALARWWAAPCPHCRPLENVPLVQLINENFKSLTIIGNYEVMVQK